MLQIAFIRQNTELVKHKLGIKNFKDAGIVDEILVADEEVRQLKKRIEDAQMQINSKSAQIPKLYKEGKKDEADRVKEEVILQKSLLSDDKPQLDTKSKKLEDLLLRLPNLPSDKVPPGKTPEDNMTVKEGGKRVELPTQAAPHWDLIKKYDIVDFETKGTVLANGNASIVPIGTVRFVKN